MGGQIRFLDWLSGDALEEVLTNAALFVLPSDLEGLSLALLDAMGAGVCALAVISRRIAKSSKTLVSFSGAATWPTCSTCWTCSCPMCGCVKLPARVPGNEFDSITCGDSGNGISCCL